MEIANLVFERRRAARRLHPAMPNRIRSWLSDRPQRPRSAGLRRYERILRVPPNRLAGNQNHPRCRIGNHENRETPPCGPTLRVRRQVAGLDRPNDTLGMWDIVLIRNVMIYFKPEVKKTILTRIARMLAKDGFLVLGGTETTTWWRARPKRCSTSPRSTFRSRRRVSPECPKTAREKKARAIVSLCSWASKKANCVWRFPSPPNPAVSPERGASSQAGQLKPTAIRVATAQRAIRASFFRNCGLGGVPMR